MKLEILGCSGGIGKGLKTTTFRVDDTLIIDPGTGMEKLEMEEMLAIRNILITHAHLDHIIGLPLMLATIYDQSRHPIQIYALPDVVDALQAHIFNWTVWPDYTQLPEDNPIICLNSIQAGDQLTLEGKQIQVLPAAHPTPTVGYVLRDQHSSFAFTGDTGMNPQLWPVLNEKKPDLLIIDVSFTDDQGELAHLSGHLTPSQLAQELENFHHRTEIRVTHLKPGNEDMIVARCHELLPEWTVDRLHHDEIIEL